MVHEFRATRRVEFVETDMAGIMHFSVFFPYMEQTEHAFYRSLGFSVIDPKAERALGWPRVHASCDYRSPLRYEDEVEVQLLVREKRSRSIRYEFNFRKLGSAEIAAQGRLTVVCVAGDPAGTMKAVPLPPEIADKIETAPPEKLAQETSDD